MAACGRLKNSRDWADVGGARLAHRLSPSVSHEQSVTNALRWRELHPPLARAVEKVGAGDAADSRWVVCALGTGPLILLS